VTQFECGRDSGGAEFGEVVLEGAADFLDEAMDAEAFEQVGDLGLRKGGHRGAHVACAETADAELAASEGVKELEVVGVEEIEATVGTFVLADGRADLFDVTQSGGGIVDATEEVEVADAGGLHQAGEDGKAVDRLLDRGDLERRGAVAMYHLAGVFKEGDVIGRALDACNGAEFVVELEGYGTHEVFDAGALDLGGEIAAHFPFAEGVNGTAQEGGDVFGLDGVDGGAREVLVEGQEVGAFLEEEIDGVFELRDAPVDAAGEGGQGGAIVCDDPIQFAVEFADVDEGGGISLGRFEVVDSREGVVLKGEGGTGSTEAACQDVVTVEVELEAERSPGGDAQEAEPQIGIDEVEIEVGAFPRSGFEARAVGDLVVPRHKAAASLRSREDVNQSRGIASCLEDFGNAIFLAEVLFGDVLDGEAVFSGQGFGACAQLIGEGFSPLGKIEDPDGVLVEIVGQGTGVADVRKGARQDNAVEASQGTGDLGGMAFFKGGHGQRHGWSLLSVESLTQRTWNAAASFHLTQRSRNQTGLRGRVRPAFKPFTGLSDQQACLVPATPG